MQIYSTTFSPIIKAGQYIFTLYIYYTYLLSDSLGMGEGTLHGSFFAGASNGCPEMITNVSWCTSATDWGMKKTQSVNRWHSNRTTTKSRLGTCSDSRTQTITVSSCAGSKLQNPTSHAQIWWRAAPQWGQSGSWPFLDPGWWWHVMTLAESPRPSNILGPQNLPN